ncbi:MAG: class I SAM-dependent methyltransferase [Propionicimonas sp.]
MPVDEAIAGYYERSDEDGRLRTDRVELLRTRELLSAWLPPAPAEVLDIGGAAGVHALWLAAQGYVVDLVDPMAKHVDRARAASQLSERPLRHVSVGDARKLDYPDHCADVVLLLGPLYHLVDGSDRRLALAEALRVLRTGGMVVAAAIGRWASTADGLMLGYLGEDGFPAIVAQDVRTGVHGNPTAHPGWFTTAYFHTPDELVEEVTSVGFEVDGPIAVEGPWPMHESLLDGGAKQQVALAAIRRLEREPSVLGASPHLLVAGRKPR